MLSKKMTVSLMSLITIFALAFVVPSAMAGPFEIKITGNTSLSYNGTALGTAVSTNLKVESAQPIGNTALTYVQPAGDTTAGSIKVYAYDKNGLLLGAGTHPVGDVSLVEAEYTISIADDNDYAMRTPKNRQLTVEITPQKGDNPTVAKVIIEIPAIKTTDPTVPAKDKANESKLVRHTITLSEAASAAALANLPKVVSIQRLRPGSQTVVAAFQETILEPKPFDVRIVFTEKWNVDLAKVADILAVTNGTASNVTAGVAFARVGSTIAADANAAALLLARSQTLRPHPTEGVYWHNNTAANGLAGIPRPTHAGDNEVTQRNSANAAGDLIPLPTGTDNMYHQYRVTVTPHTKSADFDLKISVKSFHDGGSPTRDVYVPVNLSGKPNGREELRLRVKGAARNLTAGYKVTIPKDWIIPANGYLIIAQNKAGSEIDTSGQDADRTNDTPRATHRTPAQLKYNVIEMSSLPNLAQQFLNGVVVDVESQHAGLVVSEVMWGEDLSLDPSSNSQYIELYNPGGQYKTIDDKDETPNVNEALTLIFYAPNEFGSVPAVGTDGSLPAGITDRVGTLDTKGAYWSPGSIGSSGRSGTTAADTAAARGAVVDAVPIVSMYRAMKADGSIDAMTGQMAASWASSQGPKSANFDPLAIGVRHGTPGAATDATVTPADTAAETKAAADKAKAAADKIANTGTYPMPGEGRVYISEVMFAGGGTLPQWIEISNGDRSKEFNLSGWTITVANAVADADVSVGATATFTIPNGTMIDASAQNDTPSTILVVTEGGRSNLQFTGPMAFEQVINLAVHNETELIIAGVLTGKYTLLSDEAFMITLAPPVPAATKAPAGETAAAKATRQAAEKKEAANRKAATDMVGNLGADGAAAWALPTNAEGGRSSIIRRHIQVARGPAAPENGTMEDNWVLASETSFAQVTHIRASSYYGAANDVGTPGFRAGGALPVELSHFRPVRDKATGQVVITWSTQSELNNAGFFIKRSQQRTGEFKVINATMVAGAGTTSEKQFYTYTDTTAQPNVVYYYQIEDVSLDGNRQTLTRGIRLKGHVGAAGKATTLWGELKTSHE